MDSSSSLRAYRSARASCCWSLVLLAKMYAMLVRTNKLSGAAFKAFSPARMALAESPSERYASNSNSNTWATSFEPGQCLSKLPAVDRTSFGAVFDKIRRYSSNSSRELACPAAVVCARPFAPKTTSSRHVKRNELISVAVNFAEGTLVYRRLNGAVLLCLLLFLFEPILTSRTFEDDLNGLLPPVSADRSPTVAHIRHAWQSRDLSFMGKKVDELIDQEPANFEGYFWRGFLDLQRRDNYNAVRLLRRAEALDANCYVLKLLALSYYFLDQFQLFRGALEEASRKEPSDFAPYYYLGRFYSSGESPDFSRAAGYFQQALKRNPTHYASHYYLGYCHEIERKFRDAEQEYRRSMELAEVAGNKYGLPYQGMTRIRLLENRPAEARQFAIRAVEFAAGDVESRIVLARVYDALGLTVQAAPEWERAALLAPTNPLPLYHLYRTYSALGNMEEANRALRKYNSLIAIYGSN